MLMTGEVRNSLENGLESQMIFIWRCIWMWLSLREWSDTFDENSSNLGDARSSSIAYSVTGAAAVLENNLETW